MRFQFKLPHFTSDNLLPDACKTKLKMKFLCGGTVECKPQD